MKGLDSEAHSREAAQQRLESILRPLLDQVLAEDADKRISIREDQNLYIADAPLGDWRYISDLKLSKHNLSYRYKGKIRLVLFGLYGYIPCKEVLLITEFGNDECKTVYTIW